MKATELMKRGAKLLDEYNVEGAIAYFSRAGKFDPSAWIELARIYDLGIGVKVDRARARRFERRAHEMADKNRDIYRRELRHRAKGYSFAFGHILSHAA